ncbi:MAG: alpha/beta fold hydrolase [Coleofasciculus sp. G1-WW12-02]|uniref:alpha/beta hydrolase n=1 Tax=Coleofasciculus sp. G1-WW12-02 TaxID=3068483 RepID=UPI0032F2EDCD
MPNTTDVVWLKVSPSLQRFDQRLIVYVSEQVSVKQWEYRQCQDEPSSLEQPLWRLHEYIQGVEQPVHLIGHSTAGLLGWLYTRHYPQRVRSLTLLGVGVYPAIDWQAHYYVQLGQMQCSRQMILRQMAYRLFGNPERYAVNGLVSILERDLESSPLPHSL